MKTASNQFPVPIANTTPQKPRKWTLFEGKHEVMAADTPEQYALLKWKKKQLESAGHRFLTIKPARQ